MHNTYGDNYRLTIFGASHAEKIGVTIQGVPEGTIIDLKNLQAFMDRRAPGRDRFSTARREPDQVVFEKGVSEDGLVDSDLITAVIFNTNIRRKDYDNLRNVPRPGHADLTARLRYGKDIDMSGGGAFSGRMTAPLCIAGGIAKQLLVKRGIRISAAIDAIGGQSEPEKMEQAIEQAKMDGDSVGGIISCKAEGVPAGIGDPMFDGIENRIARIVFGIPAVKGIEFGTGFRAASMRGSSNNDAFYYDEDGSVNTQTNHAGGILGGITTGMPVEFRTAFKPTPSIARQQESVDLSSGENVSLTISGRHDPCIVPRALPVVEAACACALLDAIMEAETSRQ